MDYYQGIVLEYLRADRAMFVNTECCLQLNPGANPDTTGPHWYCDAVAVNLRERHVYLCEISFAVGLYDLAKRLLAWHMHWPGLKAALARDLHVDPDWQVIPWVFIPEERKPLFVKRLRAAYPSEEEGVLDTGMPYPKVTALEDVVPWKFRSWNRLPDTVPTPTA